MRSDPAAAAMRGSVVCRSKRAFARLAVRARARVVWYRTTMVPDFQSLMLPALRALAGESEVRLVDVRSRIAEAERLTPDDLREFLPSGRQSVFANRVSWALTHMERAGLVARVRRGVYRTTPDGEKTASDAPGRLDMKTLARHAGYADWARRTTAQPPTEAGYTTPDTPDEVASRAAEEVRLALAADVLARVRSAPPDFLESVIIDLLTAMGYGGGDREMGQVTGRSGDGGIDGTIREDALGLDEVYVQAKRYADGNTVGESDLRNFAGAIDAAGTVKGVFVTTAGFTRAARDYVKRSPKRIVLIDGEELARLMVHHNIGVRTRVVLEIKRIDEDYFEQDGA